MFTRLIAHYHAWRHGRPLSNEALFAFCAAFHSDADTESHVCWVTVELTRRHALQWLPKNRVVTAVTE